MVRTPPASRGSGELANLDRLLAHLDDDSLAAELVRAYKDATPSERMAALKAVADRRIAVKEIETADDED